MITLFQGPVTNVYQPSQPTEVVGGKLVLDFTQFNYIVQPFINGVDCSCSVIAHGTQLVSLLPRSSP